MALAQAVMLLYGLVKSEENAALLRRGVVEYFMESTKLKFGSGMWMCKAIGGLDAKFALL